MTEFWVSQKMHWCDYCKCWLKVSADVDAAPSSLVICIGLTFIYVGLHSIELLLR